MAVGGAAAAEQDKWHRTGILNTVRSARRDANRVSNADFKDLGSQCHRAHTLGDVVDLLSQPMLMQKGFSADRNGGFSQTLIQVAMHIGMHELSDLRAIFGGICLNQCVGLIWVRLRHD